ncbi:MAG: NUDIX domain-containing protein [Candidatus Delongbacteria bacterium]|jgi:8-oxo-dGTP pyrophosphatase MutT (NUDIX family)|nr:NUDIX domain-containing protein [Candidatus Delongbacteria bacterium]
MSKFEDSYVGKLRKKIGKERIIVPGARAIIRNDNGEVLLIKRKDTGRWGMPAGAAELGDSVTDTLKREVLEETGLRVISFKPLAIYTNPKYSFEYPNGDKIQMFALVFLVDEWEGDLLSETDETLDIGFFSLNDLPDTHEMYLETLDDLKNFTGELIVK